MNQYEYPHEKYMRDNALTMRSLPNDIKNLITSWQIDWKATSPKTSANSSLLRASNDIVEVIEEWLEDDKDDSPTISKKAITYKGKDAILHSLYTSGKTTITEAELKQAGYGLELGFLPKNQAHYCIKAVKGAKATYRICKR